MERLVLKVGDSGRAVELEEADVIPSWDVLRDKEGRREGEKLLWKCKAYLRAQDSQTMKQKRDALTSALRSAPLNIYLYSDGVPVDSLKNAVLDEGPEFESLEFASEKGSDWRSKASVSFTVFGTIFDSNGDVLSSNVKTEYRFNEMGRFSKRVFGKIRVRKGSDPYLAALLFIPPTGPRMRFSKRSIVVDNKGEFADFDYVLEEFECDIADRVNFSRRVIKETEEEGRKRTLYEATFAGDGAEESAESFLQKEDFLSKETIREKETGVIKVRYEVESPVDISGEVVLRQKLSVSGGGRKLDSVHTKDGLNILFWGQTRAIIVDYEEERLSYSDVPGEITMPQTPPNLELTERQMSVEPFLIRSDGSITGYKTSLKARYVSKVVDPDISGFISSLLKR
ncbi:MAG: hypothetical protein N2234_02550 [Planctomycetota bacterium]|nr:hypothetical protein [Planctomycetota bacterium]